jgi:hypothetical protein
MSHRIRQLEDALAILQSTISAERHPLLQDELLKIKFGPEVPESPQTSSHEEDKEMKQSIDALGTLTLGDSGEVKYYGRSAGSEVRFSRLVISSCSPDVICQTLMMVITPSSFFLRSHLLNMTRRKKRVPTTMARMKGVASL